MIETEIVTPVILLRIQNVTSVMLFCPLFPSRSGKVLITTEAEKAWAVPSCNLRFLEFVEDGKEKLDGLDTEE